MSPTKYILTPPDELYPLVSDPGSKSQKTYPDFDPWSHSKEDDEILIKYISKGFYATSKVSFESISARSSIQESLPKLSDRLATQFSDVLNRREQSINKIQFFSGNHGASETRFSLLSGPGFTLPSRITLTDQKKELWLQELSSPYISLAKLSKYFPHGLKRRQVLEQCCARQIPLKRAIWLLKCCYSAEWKALLSKSRDSKVVNAQLSKEWTEHFIYILEKLIMELSQHFLDHQQYKNWKTEIYYFLKLLGNCYALNLINKSLFLHWLVNFVPKIDTFEHLPITFHILMLFWHDVSKVDSMNVVSGQPLYLVIKIADTLLSKYLMVSHSKSMISDDRYIINDLKRNNKIKNSILSMIRLMICDLFQNHSLELFLFPISSWELYKPYLYEITSVFNETPEMMNEVKKKLELISYRNESLKLISSLRYQKSTEEFDSNEIDSNIDIDNIKLNYIDTNLINLLNDGAIDFDWATYVDRELQNVSQVVQLILWAIHPVTQSHYETHQLVSRILMLTINTVEGLQEHIVEGVVWSVVFQISKFDAKKQAENVNLRSLYDILNMLIGYGIIKVSTYIRKLISSGVLYLSNSEDKFFHCTVLINLKISLLMKSQYNMVLRNVMEYDMSYYEKYNFDLIIEAVDVMKSTTDLSEIDFKLYPQNVKTIFAESYLNSICNGDLTPTDKEHLLQVFDLFCFKLNCFHFFYRWMEFLIYRQLISDIETMETITDILIRYGKHFSQFINDHVLFTKTFILILSFLKVSDNAAYSITSFMPFWRFFMKNFSTTLNYDTELKSELSAVYEGEKLKAEKLLTDKQLLPSINTALNGNAVLSHDTISNFPEVFQCNLRMFLNENTDGHLKKQTRYMLMLLIKINAKDYNRFIAIFLKRKDYKMNDLINLVSSKLLTFEQVQNTLGIESSLKLLMHYDFTNKDPVFEFCAETFVNTNYKTILNACQQNMSEFMKLYVNILQQHANNSKFLETSLNNLIGVFKDSSISNNEILKSLMNPQNDPDSDVCEENVFKYINFSNLWVLQGYTRFRLEQLIKDGDDMDECQLFLFKLIQDTNYSSLCCHLFGKFYTIASTEKIINLFEKLFFQNCLQQLELSDDYLKVTIEIITFLLQQVRVNNIHAISTVSSTFVQYLNDVVSYFASLTIPELKSNKVKLDSFLKVALIHQNSMLKYFVDMLNDHQDDKVDKFLDSMFDLFDKISFDLGLKLMLYEILSSIKSYCLFVITTENTKNNASTSTSANTTANTSATTSSSSSASSMYSSMTTAQFQLPPKLETLPPFEVSSFISKNSAVTKEKEPSSSGINLGIRKVGKDKPKKVKKHYDSSNPNFIYDRKLSKYCCQFTQQIYHKIENYQSESSTLFNNSGLNLSLFDASYQKKNLT